MWGDDDPIVEEAQWGVDDPVTRPPATDLPEYSPPKSYRDLDNPLSAKELADYLSGETYGKNWVQRIPVLGELYNEITTGMLQAGDEMGAVLDRLGGTGDAEKRLKRADTHGQAAETVMQGGRLNPRVSRGVRGAARSLTQMVPASVGGLPGVVGAAAITRANRGLQEAEDAGLEGGKKYAYASTQGAIEGTVTALLSKIGFGGLESQLLSKNIANAGIKGAIKQVGVRTAQEIPEEVIIEAMDASVQTLSGVDPTAATPENLADTITQVMATTIISTVTVGTVQQAGQLLKKGSVSRREYKELFPDRKVPNAGQRLRDVQQLVAQPQAAEEAAPQVEQPEIAPEQPPTAPGVFAEGSEPPIAPGFVRVYHGGDPENMGARWFTPERKYAEIIAKKSPGAEVMYLDLPEDSPLLRKAFDDSGTSAKAPYIAFNAPPEIARQAKTVGRQTQFEEAPESQRPGERPQESLPGQQEMFDEISGETKPEAKTWQQAAKQENLPPDQMRDAVEEIHGMQMAQWEEMAPIRQFRQKHFGIIQKLREKDSDAVKRFDEIADDFMRAHPGWVETSDELAQIVRAEPEAKPRKNSPEVIREAVEMVQGGAYESLSEQFAPGGRTLPKLVEEEMFATPPVADFGKVGRSARNLWVKWMTSKGRLGDLPGVFESVTERKGERGRLEYRAERMRKELNRMTRKLFGKSLTDLPDRQRGLLDAALRDDKFMRRSLPPELHGPISAMRTELDTLARRAMQTMDPDSELYKTFQKNLGKHVTRSYRVFDDPEWANKVKPAVRSDAEVLLRNQNPNWSDNQIQQTVNRLLFEGKAADERPRNVMEAVGRLDRADIKAIMKREDIAPEIRALWGEYKDAQINFISTQSRLAEYVTGREFLTRLLEQGQGKFLWKPDDPNIDPEAKAKISSEGTAAAHPIDGYYTFPWLRDALRDVSTTKEHGMLVRSWLTANSLTKLAKVPLSWVTVTRNVLSGPGIMLNNGHLLANPKTLFNGAQKFFTDDGFYEDLIRRGVVRESVHIGELRKLMAESNLSTIEEVIENLHLKWFSRAAKAGYEKSTSFYQAGDDIRKAISFVAEMDALKSLSDKDRSVLSGTEGSLEDHAAEIVRNTDPTYSLVPKAVKAWRVMPVFGPFISWPAEIVRTKTHQLLILQRAMRNEGTRGYGSRRAAGMLIKAAVFGEGLTLLYQWLNGVDDEEDEAVREFVPPWNENSRLLYTSEIEDGKVQAIDQSYVDPDAYLEKAVIAVLRGDSWEEALGEGLKELAEPFINEELFLNKVVDAARNKKAESGGAVYNENDPAPEQTRDIANHLWEAFEPGTLTSLRRAYKGATGYVEDTGKDYSAQRELMAMFTGQRTIDIDVRRSLGFKVRHYTRALRRESSQMTRKAMSEGTVTDEDLKHVFGMTERNRRTLFEKMHKTVHAAVKLGVPSEEVVKVLRDNGVSEQNANNLLRGVYLPWQPREARTQQRMKDLLELSRSALDSPEARQQIAEARESGLKSKSSTLARSKPVLGKITAKAADPEGTLRGAALLKARQARLKRLTEDWESETESAYRWLKERGLELKDVLRNYRGTQRGNLLRRWRELGG